MMGRQVRDYLGVAIVGVLALGVSLFVAYKLSDRGGDSPAADPAPTATDEPAAPAVAAPPPEEGPPVEELSLEEVLAQLVPVMGDTEGEVDPGTLLFAIWAAQGLSWDDVYVAKDETSIGRVHKDPDAERGKRACYSGKLIEIHKEAVRTGTLWTGGMVTPRADVIRFIAAGGSGELVGGSRARLCGFVTGRQSYANSAGGVTHAVMMVGMFRLPENMPAPAPAD